MQQQQQHCQQVSLLTTTVNERFFANNYSNVRSISMHFQGYDILI